MRKIIINLLLKFIINKKLLIKTGSGKTFTIFGTKRSIEFMKTGELSAESGVVFRSLN